MSSSEGVYDPDGWIPHWLSLHRSDLFAGKLKRLVEARLRAEPFTEGPGTDTLRVFEEGQEIEAEVRYALEQFPTGRIFHVWSIRSEGDPLPPEAGLDSN